MENIVENDHFTSHLSLFRCFHNIFAANFSLQMEVGIFVAQLPWGAERLPQLWIQADLTTRKPMAGMYPMYLSDLSTFWYLKKIQGMLVRFI